MGMIWFISYIICWLIFWPLASALIAKMMFPCHPLKADDWLSSMFIGFCWSAVWPLGFIGYGIYLLAKRIYYQL